jgi:hypothetical protein
MCFYDLSAKCFTCFFVYVFQLFGSGLPKKIIPVLVSIPVVFFSCIGYFRVVFAGGVGKNGSTVAVSNLQLLSASSRAIAISFKFADLDQYIVLIVEIH